MNGSVEGKREVSYLRNRNNLEIRIEHPVHNSGNPFPHHSNCLVPSNQYLALTFFFFFPFSVLFFFNPSQANQVETCIFMYGPKAMTSFGGSKLRSLVKPLDWQKNESIENRL